MYKETDLTQEIQKKLIEAYHSSLSNAIKRGMRCNQKHGVWCHKAPYGYKNIHDDNDHFRHKIIKDPKCCGKVHLAFAFVLTGGCSIAEIGRILKISPSLLRRMLKNPFYAGYIKDTDNPKMMYKGNWEPLITEDQFNKVQKLLKPKKKLNDATA